MSQVVFAHILRAKSEFRKRKLVTLMRHADKLSDAIVKEKKVTDDTEIILLGPYLFHRKEM